MFRLFCYRNTVTSTLGNYFEVAVTSLSEAEAQCGGVLLYLLFSMANSIFSALGSSMLDQTSGNC